MTNEDKICPVMSRPVQVRQEKGETAYYDFINRLIEVPCQRERCMAWVQYCGLVKIEDNGKMVTPCTPMGCPAAPSCKEPECQGHCRLLVRGER